MELPTIAVGKKLFSSNCAACHSLFHHPHVLGIEDRALLRAWIRNSHAVFVPENIYLAAIPKAYDVQIPPFTNLANKEIDLILDYIQVVTVYQQLPKN